MATASKTATRKYHFEQLVGDNCSPADVQDICDLLQASFLDPSQIDISSSGIVYSCNQHHVLVVRDHQSKKRPIVGALTLVTEMLFTGRFATIKLPVVHAKHQEVSLKLFTETLEFARKHNIVRVEVPHYVREVLWGHKPTLQKLGFSEVGCHTHHISLT